MKAICRHSVAGQGGYALISVVFMVAAMIATVMICTYPLAHERRKEARDVITKMRDIKVKRALLGRLADQRAGQYANCGGLFSDTGPKNSTTGRSYHLRYAFTKRGFLTGAHGSTNGDWHQASYAEPFFYDAALGFWAGYRGKRYYPALVTDRSVDPWFYDGHGEPYCIKLSCLKAVEFYPLRSGETNFINIGHRREYRIRLRDYTRSPSASITMELVMVSGQTATGKLAGNEDGALGDGRPESTETPGGCHVHTFHFFFTQNASGGRSTAMTGLLKAIIRIDDRVVFTAGLVCPVYGRNQGMGAGHTVTDLFATEIEYHG